MAESNADFAFSQCAGIAQADYAACITRNAQLWDFLQFSLWALPYAIAVLFSAFLFREIWKGARTILPQAGQPNETVDKNQP